MLTAPQHLHAEREAALRVVSVNFHVGHQVLERIFALVDVSNGSTASKLVTSLQAAKEEARGPNQGSDYH